MAADNFHNVGVGEFLRIGYGRHGGDEFALGVAPACRQCVEEPGGDAGFVSLYIQKEIARECVDGTCETRSPGRAVRWRRKDGGPKVARDGGNLLAIGEDDDARGGAHLAGALPDVLEDGLAGEIEEDFSGEACGGEACGYGYGDAHVACCGKGAAEDIFPMLPPLAGQDL